MSRTGLRKALLGGFGAVALALGGALPSPAVAAAAASADLGDRYAGAALAKVVAVWAPPPALKGDFRVRVRVSIDDKGRAVQCVPVQPSGMDAFDQAACGAVRAVGAFGAPPYAQPIDIYIVFWNGTPKGAPRPPVPDSAEAARAEALARTKAEAVQEGSRAASAEDAARRRAEAAALAGGKTLPPAMKDAGSDSEPSVEVYRLHVGNRLTKAIELPQATKPGVHRTRLLLQIAADGKITACLRQTSTGDALLDKAVRSGIRRIDKLPPPPAACGGRLDITLTLSRRNAAAGHKEK